ncbi:MAG TPA: PIG-L family deacetylase [Verrucomicrobiae bacterium]|nr:PIG-L family deacetylase [Verrucomicrobiae bacterium]
MSLPSLRRAAEQIVKQVLQPAVLPISRSAARKRFEKRTNLLSVAKVHSRIRMFCGGLALLFGTLLSSSAVNLDQPVSSAAILQELRGFREMGSVLYVAAHPDDENTQLIAYLARGRNYRTAYLSLTRGDGGQNVLGPDFDEKLGVARTQELLAARRLDGGRQFFTRAIDFGFSKDYRETLNIWNKQEILSDVVRVIRTFRPDVIVTRFSPEPGRTHGHHTASAVLALEAFKLAADTNAFPEQLKDLKPWQPKRILMNGRGGDGLRMEISGDDPVSGLSFGELAARSRAMHKTQGFDNFRGFGGRGSSAETFQLLDGEPATNDIMDGVETTWKRYPGGELIDQLAGEAIAGFSSNNPIASVPALLKLRLQLADLPNEALVREKRSALDHALAACVGLRVQTTIPHAEVVPGETFKIKHSVTAATNASLRWLAVRYPSIGEELKTGIELREGKAVVEQSSRTLPKDTPLTQPYWLREGREVGTFHVSDPSLIGLAENPPVFPVEYLFEIGGQTFTLSDVPIELAANANDQPRALDVIPPVSLGFGAEVTLFSPGTSRIIEVNVSANRQKIAGTLSLEVPGGWIVSPQAEKFNLAHPGAHSTVRFTVTAPKESITAKFFANAEVGGVNYRNAREVVHYRHIPLQLLQPIAATKAVSLDLATRGKNIGYLPGAGDDIPAALKQMDYAVTILEDANLTVEKMKSLDAIVIGVRALNVRPKFEEELPVLFQYVENGGTVVAQYNRPQGGRDFKIAPFELHVSGERVTDENAAMTFLAPDSPVLNVPNKITLNDFKGWVQERGVYFPDRWDNHFTPILACNDPGENSLNGGLLVAEYGKGHFVYTGLAFFRQLPAGVPGAYRLFANLVSLGK